MFLLLRPRRLIIALLVLLGLLVVADRVAANVAQRQVADRVETEQRLSTRPDVSIGGFPFLTQAISGTYDDVTVRVHDVNRGGVTITSIVVHASGVHASLGAVLSNHLSQVPVDHATATVVLSYADLNAYLARGHFTVAYAGGGAVKVTGSATVAGHTISASGTGRVELADQSVVIHASGVPAAVTIPLAGLPFGIQLESATATNQGIVVAASAQGLVVRSLS